MKYIGIDGSTTSTGIGICEDDRLIYYKCLKPPKSKEWEDRIGLIALELNDILKVYNDIEMAFIEDIPLKDGKPTIKKLGCVRGALKAILTLNNIPLSPQPVNEWRKNAGFFDGTQEGLKRDKMKKKAIEEVNNLFGIDVNDDVAEGILVGYRTVNPKKKKSFGASIKGGI